MLLTMKFLKIAFPSIASFLSLLARLLAQKPRRHLCSDGVKAPETGVKWSSGAGTSSAGWNEAGDVRYMPSSVRVERQCEGLP